MFAILVAILKCFSKGSIVLRDPEVFGSFTSGSGSLRKVHLNRSDQNQKQLNGWRSVRGFPEHFAIPQLQNSLSVLIFFVIIDSLLFTHQYILLKSLQKKTFKRKLFTPAKNSAVRPVVTVVTRYKDRTQYNGKYL